MGIINAVMVPHPPLIIPEVGKGQEKEIQATITSYEKAAQFIMEAAPDTIIILSPHSIMYQNWFHISPGKKARGNFAQYRAGKVCISTEYDSDFIDELNRLSHIRDFPAGTEGERDSSLDHATMIPLWFLQKAYGEMKIPPIVRIGLSGEPLAEHYRFGMMIRETAEKLGKKVSVIASGDLSHRLTEEGPYGYKPEGPRYDERIMKVMGNADFGELFMFSSMFCEKAAECGHRAFTVMAGCFDGREVNADKLSYEGPFGVGYGVCEFVPGEKDKSRRFLEIEENKALKELAARKNHEDEYLQLARLSVETYVKTGEKALLPEDLSKELVKEKAGVFVSLHIAGQLRGCIGTISSTTSCVAEEILQNAISACSEDNRFSPVTERELILLEYSVDVLSPAEFVGSPDELDVKRYGVIVSSGNKRGLLLPNLEGVDTVEEQINIARRKGGISANETVRLLRFEVTRHQ